MGLAGDGEAVSRDRPARGKLIPMSRTEDPKSASCLHIISGDLWGGKEAQVELLARETANAAAPVSVLLFNRGEAATRYRQSGINCSIAEEDRGLVSLIRRTASHLAAERPAVVITHGYKELILAALLKATRRYKLIAVLHGLPEPHGNWRLRLKAAVYSLANQCMLRLFADRIVCVSSALRMRAGLAQLSKAVVIGNCVDLEQYAGNLPAVAERDPGKRIIFMAGRLVPVKRFDLAVRALGNLAYPDVELQIAGVGPERPALESLIAELSLSERVRLLGFRRDIAQLLAAADVFLLSSDSEGMPTILLEALSAGCRAVCTAVGGIPEIVERIGSASCTLVPRGDITALADALTQALQQPPVSSDKIDAVRREVAREFSPEVTAQRYLELIASIIPK